MGNISDCHWKYEWFKNIAACSPDSGDFTLRYWGTHFDDPKSYPNYFVIEKQENGVPAFRIASRDVAARYGCLGEIPEE